MLNKSLFLTLLIFGLCLGLVILIPGLTGCSSRAPEPVGVDPALSGFVGGPDALKIGVLQGAPPEMIQDAGMTPFSFVISVENVGEAEVGSGTDNPLVLARLTGIMYANFGLTEQTAVQAYDSVLEPAKRTFDGGFMPGENDFISFDNLAYEPNIAESFSLIIRAEVCYDYENFATTQFCMKRDLLEAWEDASICTLSGPKPVFNSGGPIHVTAVEEAPVSSDTVQLNFFLEHVGSGVFFARGEYDNLFEPCFFDESNPGMFYFEMFVEPIEGNAYEVDCMRLDTPLPGGGESGMVRMYMGAPLVVSCYLKRVQPMNVRLYTDILNVKFRYRYGEYLDVPIFIHGHPI